MTITITATINLATAPGTVVTNQGTAIFDADGNGSNEASVPTDDPGVTGAANPTVVTVGAASTMTGDQDGDRRVLSRRCHHLHGDPDQHRTCHAARQSGARVHRRAAGRPDAIGTFSATSGLMGPDVAPNSVAWNGSLASGATVTITITATIDASTARGTVVTNQGRAYFDADGNGSNETLAFSPTIPVCPARPTRPALPSPPAASVTGTKTVTGTFSPGGAHHLHGRPDQLGTLHAGRQSGQRVHRRPAGQSDPGQRQCRRAGPRWRRWGPTPSRGMGA